MAEQVKIVNRADVNQDETTRLLRKAFAHRATWFALLLEEAKRMGIDPETLGRRAVKRCGCIMAEANIKPACGDPGNMRAFFRPFVPETTQKVFDMTVSEMTDDTLALEFHYCPLVDAWEKLGRSQEEIALLCDIAMDGALVGGTGFAAAWLEKMQTAFVGGTLGYLFILLALFGILIALLDVSGAVLEFANWLAKYANTRKKALIITYVLGWIIFVDDYLNNMAVSTAMKKVCDKHGIPRTFLGYVVNSTAAPVCILIPISTWAVFYSGLFEEYGVLNGGSGLSAYIAGIPYLFFAWITLVVLLLVILGVIPLIGITRKDSRIAAETGVVCTREQSIDDVELTAGGSGAGSAEADAVKGNPWNFIIPLAGLIALTIFTNDVMIGCMGGILLSGILMLAERKVKLARLFDSAYQGVTSMVQICCVITMAIALVEINAATGMADYVVSVLEPVMNSAVLPAVVFGFCAVYSYFGGGFWDMSMVFMPIVVPLANAMNMDPLLSCAALICAAAAGSTTYVAGDAVMITARAVDIKPFYQMLGTLPYAAVSYVLTVVAFVIAGFSA
ncbi:MAG: L-2-amino-thiazoline-4-carboxylic acid hydrolase [Clostridiales Family XIII bacterium]|jgi:Na+/H+ antiporter NhaC|nr:L-2-amino-thiazoline-4-carboxylic acid hydrolase [Clostridiales Family XIII bacterium]